MYDCLVISTRTTSSLFRFLIISSPRSRNKKNYFFNHLIQDLIKICLTMAKGLAHLHGLFSTFWLRSNTLKSSPQENCQSGELGANKGQGVKPSIAHRDFKSKNVLIKVTHLKKENVLHDSVISSLSWSNDNCPERHDGVYRWLWTGAAVPTWRSCWRHPRPGFTAKQINQ